MRRALLMPVTMGAMATAVALVTAAATSESTRVEAAGAPMRMAPTSEAPTSVATMSAAPANAPAVRGADPVLMMRDDLRGDSGLQTPYASDVSYGLEGGGAVRRGYREMTLPAGTVLPLTLETTVASNSSRVEDRVRARLRRAVVVQGRTVLPAGTPVSGFVSEARESGRVKGRGRVGVRFTSLSAYDESYRLRTSSVVREAPGTKKKDAAKIAIPAGAGALIGGLVKGGKGAAIGAAAGGAGGTAVVLSTRGQAARIGSGASLGVRLLQPLTVRVPVS